ncbi:MAG: hypothetical protein QM785_18090 [Pyrinomonadaceae bacterium]
MSRSEKPYDISYEVRPEYLYAFVTGDLTIGDVKVDCWRKIIGRCRSGSHDRVLVVLDGNGTASDTVAFEASRQIVEIGLTGLQIAYVDLDPESFEKNQFCETVVGNRGGFAKVFKTEQEAEAWLIGR